MPQPKNVYTESERVKKRENWKNNKRAGLFYKEIEKPYIDKKRLIYLATEWHPDL